jgi:hypothetical protein
MSGGRYARRAKPPRRRPTSANGNSRNAFHEHSADLFGYNGLQRVEAVYVPNRFETGIIWVGVIARNNTRHLWHFELAESVTAVPVIPIAAPEQPAVASF